ncbi:2-keto-4-pentenoate hydratase [Pseudoalteromonas sp. SWYJZ12]|uniref:2-keto-4-pentenoate hydratase n=1 Tax=Pseudoalteromonas sp. SWYJZ12 TaxID=2792067 RepID=UPI0018CE3064|nr:2-keto-4-pentenoate hydratase [Pseudoalteromonas sp. SWYJZ12]MBH0001504.1 2-keto-4-pentenoate hydratase [Pseudoalteromonas sp. SWYJZ12]
MNNSIQLKLIATHLLAQREENPARSNFPKELVLDTTDDAIEVQKLMIYLNEQTVYGWKCMLPLDDGSIILAPLLHAPIKQAENCPLYTTNNKALIEPEIAFILQSDLPSNKIYKNEDVDTAFASAHLALELIQKRFDEDTPSTHIEKLADGLSNQGVYLGPQIDKAKAYNASTVNINVKQTELELNLAGVHPAKLAQLPLYWAVNYLSAKGINLKAGQVFITGSYCGVVELNTDQLTTVSYEDLGSVSTTFLSK